MSPSPISTVIAVVAGTTIALGAAVVVIRRKRRSRESDEQRKENDDVDAMFPEVQGVPFLGMALGLLKAQHPAQSIMDATKKLGSSPFWGTFFGMKVLFLVGSDQVKWALNKGEGKYVTYGWPQRWGRLFGGNSIAFKDKADHRKLRNLLSKGISKNAISFFYPALRQNCSTVLTHLAASSQNGTKDVQPHESAKTFTYNAICSFLGCADPSHEDIFLSLRDDFLAWTNGLGDLFVPESLVWISPFAKGMKARERIVAKVMEVVRDRRRRMESGETFRDGIGYLIEARDEDGDTLTDDEIANNFINLCFAGFDTTAASICSIFHVLTHEISTEELRLLRTEALSAPDPLEETSLTALPVLDAFVKEMLRLYSPVVGVMKKMAETTTLEDGRTVRAGTILNISFLANHLNEEVYPDAGKFRLKRFLVDEVDKKFPGDFTPFSVGVRLCLGQHLARLEMKMFTVELLRHYELTRGSRPSGFLKFPIYMATPHIRLSKCDALRQWQQQQQMAVKQEQMLANAAVRNKKEEYNASPKLAQKPSVDARRAVMMSKKKGLF